MNDINANSILLKEDEKLDDLQRDNLFLIQNKKNYCFSSDSVLLSNFAQVGHKDKVAEFCSGSGVVSILINAKYNPQSIVGFEIQDNLCDMSNRSLLLNNIKNIKFLNCSVIDAKKVVENNVFDVVVCNPPYYPVSKAKNFNQKYKIAKYEFEINLDQIFLSASQVLKFSGKMFLVHITDRLEEILITANKYDFNCKQIEFVFAKNKTKSHLALFKFVKGGKFGIEVSKPLIV